MGCLSVEKGNFYHPLVCAFGQDESYSNDSELSLYLPYEAYSGVNVNVPSLYNPSISHVSDQNISLPLGVCVANQGD